MNRQHLFVVLLFVSVTLTWGQATSVTHQEFQAVTESGDSAFTSLNIGPVILEGIILNIPEQWLDPTPDPTVAQWFMGGQWQIFIQGEGDDHAGTACWMGQNYANNPYGGGDFSYTNEEWIAEIQRLNRDPNTGYIFRPGDRVRVTGNYLHYNGKVNINENHSTDTTLDFTLELVKPQVGLPHPECICLTDLKDDADEAIFDPNRLTGPEYYQGCLVRIEDVNVVDPENWGQDQTIVIADNTGRTFDVELGLGTGLAQYECPTGQIDVVGVMNQEGTYCLLVLDYDGNGLVLGQMTTQRGNLPEDVNGDYMITADDVNQVEAALGQECVGLTP